MRKYLYVSLVCFAIAIISILFMGCVPYWQSSCGHNSVLAVTVTGAEYPTRVAIGYVSEADKADGKAHAQTEYFRDGKWRPLQVFPWPEVVEGKHEFELIDVIYVSGKDFLEKYKNMLKH